MKMRTFKVTVYNSVTRAKYFYRARFISIQMAIDHYSSETSRVVEVKEMGVRL
jgi:hypothetical protein